MVGMVYGFSVPSSLKGSQIDGKTQGPRVDLRLGLSKEWPGGGEAHEGHTRGGLRNLFCEDFQGWLSW